MINYIFAIVQIALLWFILGKLKLIAEDTQKKEDIKNALEKLKELYDQKP
jgi:hypothetical protein